jgi:PII-like signaling protein
MKSESTVQVMRIYVGEQDNWHGKPLYAAIVIRLKECGIAGVTVFRGVEGYGSHHTVHTARIEVLFQGLPMVIEAVDLVERIVCARQVIDEMVTEGLVTIHDAHAITYAKD